MLKKLRKWVKENCPSPIAPLVIFNHNGWF